MDNEPKNFAEYRLWRNSFWKRGPCPHRFSWGCGLERNFGHCVCKPKQRRFRPILRFLRDWGIALIAYAIGWRVIMHFHLGVQSAWMIAWMLSAVVTGFCISMR